nr:MAG TPA: hypothetical protein [Caudoviricetes sp.]
MFLAYCLLFTKIKICVNVSAFTPLSLMSLRTAYIPHR